MDKRSEIILIISAVVIFALIITIGFISRPSEAPISQPPSASPGSQPPAGSLTWKPIGENITVPSPTSPKSDFANPKDVIVSTPGSSEQTRSFSFSISQNAFSHNQLAVYLGDDVMIKFTAVDKSYDVYQPDYGWKQIIPKGATKMVSFGANAAGKFTFYCSSCGGPYKGPVGYLYVVPR